MKWDQGWPNNRKTDSCAHTERPGPQHPQIKVLNFRSGSELAGQQHTRVQQDDAGRVLFASMTLHVQTQSKLMDSVSQMKMFYFIQF